MQEIQVVGAAIKDGDKILAAKRTALMKSPLKWEFPGGKVEEKEAHQQALVREVYEELGIIVRVKDYIASGHSIVGEKRIALHVYYAEIIEGKPIAKEHADLRWVEINKIKGLDWAEADIPICDELLKQTY
jgi:8-oxo-dGTP diphosphatase